MLRQQGACYTILKLRGQRGCRIDFAFSQWASAQCRPWPLQHSSVGVAYKFGPLKEIERYPFRLVAHIALDRRGTTYRAGLSRTKKNET